MTRFAICGIGNIGKVHLVSLLATRGCQVSGIFDSRRAELEEVARRFSLRAYATEAEMFADSSVDAVIVATPSGSHRVLTETALAAGKHVFVEKPLASTLADAQAMVDAARLHPRLVVQAGFCERFNPQFIEARRAVRSGLLGELRCIHSSRVAPYALCDPAWELGALDTAVHNLDLVLWLLQATPVNVLARGVRLYNDSAIPHSITILLEFAGGVLVTDSITWLSDRAHPLRDCARARMHILGNHGSFEVNLATRPSALLTSEGYREIDTVILGGEGYAGCLKLQFDGFLRAIEEGAPVVAPIEDAYRAERVVLAARQSLQTGLPVELR